MDGDGRTRRGLLWTGGNALAGTAPAGCTGSSGPDGWNAGKSSPTDATSPTTEPSRTTGPVTGTPGTNSDRTVPTGEVALGLPPGRVARGDR